LITWKSIAKIYRYKPFIIGDGNNIHLVPINRWMTLEDVNLISRHGSGTSEYTLEIFTCGE
jgi:hypothetical protein